MVSLVIVAVACRKDPSTGSSGGNPDVPKPGNGFVIEAKNVTGNDNNIVSALALR